MSAPQPPADEQAGGSGPGRAQDSDPRPGEASPGYDFHGEKLDFDPYRFGAPEPSAPTWNPPGPPAPGAERPPAPGERWTPGGGDARPDVRPGDYWQGGGSAPRGGEVFPPPGYAPPSGPPSGIDLGKAPAPSGPAGPAGPATGYPPPGHPPPSGYPGYPPPGAGGYPTPPGQPGRTGGGNGLAVAGFVLGLVGLVLSFTSWPGILVGLVGLGLSIPGFLRSRRGAPLKGLAVAGIACSVAAVVIGSIVLAVYLSRVDFDCVRDAGSNFDQAQECVK